MFANSRNIMKRDMDKFNLTQFECRVRNLKNLLANRKKLNVFFLLLQCEDVFLFKYSVIVSFTIG